MTAVRKCPAVKIFPVVSRKESHRSLFVFKDAPGATPNAGWQGDLRAIKWKDQEGLSHKGCKGKVNSDHELKFDLLMSINWLLYII